MNIKKYKLTTSTYLYTKQGGYTAKPFFVAEWRYPTTISQSGLSQLVYLQEPRTTGVTL